MTEGLDSELGEAEAVVVRKRRKGIYILPNLVTLAALFGGFYSIVMAMNGRFDMAAIGVFCAMACATPLPGTHGNEALLISGLTLG